MKRRGEVVTRESIEFMPRRIQHYPVDHHALMIEFSFVFLRESDDVCVVTLIGKESGNAIEVIGQATIEVAFGNKLGCDECNPQLHNVLRSMGLSPWMVTIAEFVTIATRDTRVSIDEHG